MSSEKRDKVEIGCCKNRSIGLLSKEFPKLCFVLLVWSESLGR